MKGLALTRGFPQRPSVRRQFSNHMKLRSIFFASLLGLSSTLAFAQTAAIPTAVETQLAAAINAGNTAQIAQIAAANPTAAVTIAQRVANAAQAVATTNPAVAASLAAAATSIVTSPSVTTAISSNASVASAVANVAKTATDVAATPAVKAAVASNPAVAVAVNTVTANSSTIASNPAVQSAAPQVVSQITNNVQAVSNPVSIVNSGSLTGGNKPGEFTPEAISGGGGSNE